MKGLFKNHLKDWEIRDLEDQIEGFRTVYAEGNRGPAWSHTGAGSMWSSKELLLKET